MTKDQKMKNNVRIQTAESCGVIRAAHFLHGKRPLVFEDAVAFELLGPDGRERSIAEKEMGLGGGAGIVLGRARYTEDLLEKAVARSGVDQYVLLGAGMDTFAMRRKDLLETMRVYEIDRPETQAWKRERMAQLGRELPMALEFIPVDFEQETIAEALGRSSYRSDRPTFFSWLGVLPYLTKEAILRTLESIATVTAAGSEIVFDYRVAMEFVDPKEVALVQAGDQHTAQGGEPKLSFLNPHTFPQEVCALGYALIENLSAKQLGERYFAGRDDELHPRSHHYYAHFRRC